MNTIDNLVEIIGKCVADGCHLGCPFEQRCLRDNKQELLSEALHYLKEYKSDKDALHYLKEYRDKAHKLDIDIAEHHRTFEQLGIEIARYQKAKAEMEEISADYVALKQWWAEQQENPPLSWDELKTMEGKPVWYEHEFWKGWIILGKVEQGVTCEMIPDREEKWYIVKDGSAKAYRKEMK